MRDDRDTLNQVARVAQLAAQLMLGNGGETYRAEETARHIGRAFGYETEAIAFPTGIMLSVGGERSLIGRVSRRQVDFFQDRPRQRNLPRAGFRRAHA